MRCNGPWRGGSAFPSALLVPRSTVLGGTRGGETRSRSQMWNPSSSGGIFEYYYSGRQSERCKAASSRSQGFVDDPSDCSKTLGVLPCALRASSAAVLYPTWRILGINKSRVVDARMEAKAGTNRVKLELGPYQDARHTTEWGSPDPLTGCLKIWIRDGKATEIVTGNFLHVSEMRSGHTENEVGM